MQIDPEIISIFRTNKYAIVFDRNEDFVVIRTIFGYEKGIVSDWIYSMHKGIMSFYVEVLDKRPNGVEVKSTFSYNTNQYSENYRDYIKFTAKEFLTLVNEESKISELVLR